MIYDLSPHPTPRADDGRVGPDLICPLHSDSWGLLMPCSLKALPGQPQPSKGTTQDPFR